MVKVLAYAAGLRVDPCMVWLQDKCLASLSKDRDDVSIAQIQKISGS